MLEQLYQVLHGSMYQTINSMTQHQPIPPFGAKNRWSRVLCTYFVQQTGTESKLNKRAVAYEQTPESVQVITQWGKEKKLREHLGLRQVNAAL